MLGQGEVSEGLRCTIKQGMCRMTLISTEMLEHIRLHLNVRINVILSTKTHDTAMMENQATILCIHALHAEAKAWMLNPSNQELQNCIIEPMDDP